MRLRAGCSFGKQALIVPKNYMLALRFRGYSKWLHNFFLIQINIFEIPILYQVQRTERNSQHCICLQVWLLRLYCHGFNIPKAINRNVGSWMRLLRSSIWNHCKPEQQDLKELYVHSRPIHVFMIMRTEWLLIPLCANEF